MKIENSCYVNNNVYRERMDTTQQMYQNTAQQNRANFESLSNYNALASQTTQPTGDCDKNTPRIEIVEQPASRSFRFRYECEGRLAGSLTGANSTLEDKTFPTIQITGYKGRAIVVVSCVSKEPPYKPHPHNLVGKDICKDGICRVQVKPDDMSVTFTRLGIQCVKKKDIKAALIRREQLGVDPFKTGFDHKRRPGSIDLNCVRLCFQVFLEGSTGGKFNYPLTPIVSEPIYDKKNTSDLMICKLSLCSAPVSGGTTVIILCEKFNKDDIQVRFFEEKDGKLVWESIVEFEQVEVHKQVAVTFKTPCYKTHQVERPVEACIQLRRPSDGATSEPYAFQLLPIETDDPDSLKRKRRKINENPKGLMLKQIQADAQKSSDLMSQMSHFDHGVFGGTPTNNPLQTMSQPHFPSMFGNPIANINGLRQQNYNESMMRLPQASNNVQNASNDVHMRSFANQPQPSFVAHNGTLPTLLENVSITQNLTMQMETNKMKTGDILDVTLPEFNLGEPQDEVDFAGLRLSDLIQGSESDEQKKTNLQDGEESDTDSYAEIMKNIQLLNNAYKPKTDD